MGAKKGIAKMKTRYESFYFEKDEDVEGRWDCLDNETRLACGQVHKYKIGLVFATDFGRPVMTLAELRDIVDFMSQLEKPTGKVKQEKLPKFKDIIGLYEEKSE